MATVFDAFLQAGTPTDALTALKLPFSPANLGAAEVLLRELTTGTGPYCTASFEFLGHFGDEWSRRVEGAEAVFRRAAGMPSSDSAGQS